MSIREELAAAHVHYSNINGMGFDPDFATLLLRASEELTAAEQLRAENQSLRRIIVRLLPDWSEAAVNKALSLALPLVHIAPDARAGKPPCGECHLHPGETCDICGADWEAK